MRESVNSKKRLKITDTPSSDYPSISIIIVNWNSKDYLRKCLASINEHASDLSPQVIVVDGASFDGCAEMLSEEYPSTSFIQSKENIGFGRCNNLGVEKADGELLLLLNPDTELKPGSLQNLISEYIGLDSPSMLGARLLNSDGSFQATSVHAAPTPLNQALGSNFLMRLFPKSSLWGTYEAYHSSTPTEVEAISGACMLLPTSLFREVGGFTPSYFMYAEDMDLCLKVRRQKVKIYHIPTSEIIHHGGTSSSQQTSHFSTLKMREAMYHYFTLNHGYNTAEQYSNYVRLSAFLHLATAPIKPSTASKWITVIKWSFNRPVRPQALQFCN